MTVNAAIDTDIAFKNCAPFFVCKKVINNTFTDIAEHIYIAMAICNLIVYSDVPDVYGSLNEMKFLLIMLI